MSRARTIVAVLVVALLAANAAIELQVANNVSHSRTADPTAGNAPVPALPTLPVSSSGATVESVVAQLDRVRAQLNQPLAQVNSQLGALSGLVSSLPGLRAAMLQVSSQLPQLSGRAASLGPAARSLTALSGKLAALTSLGSVPSELARMLTVFSTTEGQIASGLRTLTAVNQLPSIFQVLVHTNSTMDTMTATLGRMANDVARMRQCIERPGICDVHP